MSKIEKNDFNIKEIIRYKEKYIEVDANNTVESLTKFIIDLL